MNKMDRDGGNETYRCRSKGPGSALIKFANNAKTNCIMVSLLI